MQLSDTILHCIAYLVLQCNAMHEYFLVDIGFSFLGVGAGKYMIIFEDCGLWIVDWKFGFGI